MNAWMVVNEYLRTEKYKKMDELLVEAANALGLSIEVFYNTELPICYGRSREEYLHCFNLKAPEFILFWDKDVRLATWLMSLGFRVYNSAAAIALCDDKSATHQVLTSAGIQMPETIVAPFTYPNIGYSNYHFLKTPVERFGFPMVVKECFGSFGAQVYLAESETELLEIVKQIGSKPMLFQKFIQCSAGTDIRLEVVGDHVVAGMKRYSKTGDFRANLSNGGVSESYEAEAKEQELAVRCCKLLGLTFGGVDLLYGEEGEWLVCEVNSNAHFKNLYDCTGINIAQAMLSHMIKLSQTP